MQKFKTYLNWQLKELDELDNLYFELDNPSETIEWMIEQIALRAGKLGLPELVASAKGKRSLHDARVYIAECLKACQSTDMLTVTQASQLMQVNRDNVLSLINSGRLRAINTSRGHRPRYRIAKTDLENLSRVKEVGKKIRKSKSTIPDYFPQY